MTKTATYRLIDREGFIDESVEFNQDAVRDFLIDGCFAGVIDDDGNLRSDCDHLLIDYDEFKYFEKVDNNQQVSGKTEDHRDQFEAACMARPDFVDGSQLERDGDKYKLQTIQFAYEMFKEGNNAIRD